MFPSFKLYLGIALAFLLSLLGFQHQRNKAQRLKIELANHKAIKRADKALKKALAEAQQKEFDRVQKEIDNSRYKRDYFGGP